MASVFCFLIYLNDIFALPLNKAPSLFNYRSNYVLLSCISISLLRS